MLYAAVLTFVIIVSLCIPMLVESCILYAASCYVMTLSMY